MAFLMNLIMVSLLAGSAFCVIISIMAFLRVESLRITPNNNIKSGINLLITSLLFMILFVYSSWMQSYKSKADKEPPKKMSVNHKITSLHKSQDRLDLENINLDIDNEQNGKNENERILKDKRKNNQKSSKHLMMISSPTDRRNVNEKDEYFSNKNITEIVKPEVNWSEMKNDNLENLGNTI